MLLKVTAINYLLPPASSGWRASCQRSWMRRIARAHREPGSSSKIRAHRQPPLDITRPLPRHQQGAMANDVAVCW